MLLLDGGLSIPRDPLSFTELTVQEAGSKTYMCPSAACDNMIISHCTSLGYVHPAEKKVAMPQLTKLDLGCAPLVRLGIAPYTDWVQPYDTPATVSTASPWPAAWTTRAPDGMPVLVIREATDSGSMQGQGHTTILYMS